MRLRAQRRPGGSGAKRLAAPYSARMSEKSRWLRWLITVAVINGITVITLPNFIRYGRRRFNLEFFMCSVPALLTGPVMLARYRPAALSERLTAYVAVAASLLELFLQLDKNGLLALFLGR